MARKNGWKYTDPEGNEFSHGHHKAFENLIFQYRMDHGGDTTGGWQERLWDDVCRQDEGIDCEDTEDHGKWPNLADLWNFVQTMALWLAGGGKLVSEEEATRRASICLSGANGQPCPNNKALTVCMGCKGISYALDRLIDGRKTPLDDQLQVCHGCFCTLRQKIWFPVDSLKVDESKLPSFCWQRSTAPS